MYWFSVFSFVSIKATSRTDHSALFTRHGSPDTFSQVNLSTAYDVVLVRWGEPACDEMKSIRLCFEQECTVPPPKKVYSFVWLTNLFSGGFATLCYTHPMKTAWFYPDGEISQLLPNIFVACYRHCHVRVWLHRLWLLFWIKSVFCNWTVRNGGLVRKQVWV